MHTHVQKNKIINCGSIIIIYKQIAAPYLQFFFSSLMCIQSRQLKTVMTTCYNMRLWCISSIISTAVYINSTNLMALAEHIVTNASCMCSSNLHEFSVKSKLLQLPAACLRNLEVFQNGTDGTQHGSLYWLLNHTITRPGARLLKAWLAQPLRDVKSVTG